jgi:hypothetical protein
MPTTENDRLNQQKPVLERPSLPDHDRNKDPGMHSAMPNELQAGETGPGGALDEAEVASNDQEFTQMLNGGTAASNGVFHDDPNNSLTSDMDKSLDQDPEDRGDSTVDANDPDKR